MQLDAAALERTECRFRRDIWSLAPEDAVLEAGVQMRSFGPVLATVFAELPRATRLNSVRGAAEPGAIEEEHLPRAIEWVREWNVSYVVPVADGRPGSARAERWLQERGYEQVEVTRKYVRPVSRTEERRAPDVEVVPLPPEGEEGLGIIVGAGLELPELAEILFMGLPTLERWHCYLAQLEGQAAATGSMMIDEGIATLGLDATFEDSRGRGCNTALLARRLRDAAAAGCHTLAAEVCTEAPGTTPAAARNLQRFGFVEAYRTVNWQRPGEGAERGEGLLEMWPEYWPEMT